MIVDRGDKASMRFKLPSFLAAIFALAGMALPALNFYN
jgi:hypothetical protein